MTTYAEALQKTKDKFGDLLGEITFLHKYDPDSDIQGLAVFATSIPGVSFTYWESTDPTSPYIPYWEFQIQDIADLSPIRNNIDRRNQSKVARLEADLVMLKKEHQEEVYNQQVRYMRTLDFAQDTILKAIKGGYEV